MTINLTHEESMDCFFNALCNGLGYVTSGYGLGLDYDQAAYVAARDKLKSPAFEDVLKQILLDGGTLTMVDIEGDGDMTRTIILEDVYARVQKTPIKHLADMINEEDDADTADAILQTVFFEEIVFG